MRKFSKTLSLILAFIMAIALVPAQEVSGSNNRFTGDGFSVEFTLHSSWNSGYSAAIEIVNTGTQPIAEWVLVANRNLGLAEWGVSGGRVISQTANETVIAHMDWNSTIPAGGRATLSLQGSHGGEAPVPTNYRLLCANINTASRRVISPVDYSVETVVHHETAASFNHSLVLTNNTGRMIYGWEVDFTISEGAGITAAQTAHVRQTGTSVTLSQIPGSGIVWHPGMAMHLQLFGSKSSSEAIAVTNLTVYERFLEIGEAEPTPTPTPAPTPSPSPGEKVEVPISPDAFEPSIFENNEAIAYYR